MNTVSFKRWKPQHGYSLLFLGLALAAALWGAWWLWASHAAGDPPPPVAASAAPDPAPPDAPEDTQPATGTSAAEPGEQAEEPDGAAGQPGTAVVQLPAGVDRAALEAALDAAGLRITGRLPQLNAWRVEGDLGRLEALLPPGAVAAESITARIPEAPGPSWALAQELSPVFGDPLGALRFSRSASSGGRGVTVALIDTGIDAGHPALEGADIRVVDTAGQPFAGDPNGHGTAMASVIVGSEALDIPGVAPDAQLLGIAALDASGQGSDFAVAESILLALGQPRPLVIVLALGTPSPSPILADAIAEAVRQDAVIVAAPGNAGRAQVDNPAALPGVVGAAPLDANLNRPAYANSGAEIDLAVPGHGLRAAGPEDTLQVVSGTSVATALLGGLFADLRGQQPAMTAQALQGALLDTSDDLGPPGQDVAFGGGIPNLDRYEHRSTPGREDLALTDVSLDAFVRDPETGAPVADRVTLSLGVENRGTEFTAPGARLEVTRDGQTQTSLLPALAPGDTHAHSISVPVADLMDGIAFEARVTAPDGAAASTDLTPENNQKALSLRLEPIEE